MKRYPSDSYLSGINSDTLIEAGDTNDFNHFLWEILPELQDQLNRIEEKLDKVIERNCP